MHTYQQAIVAALRDKREELVGELERLVTQNNKGATRRDVEQMLAGLLRVIEEACAGDSRDIRSMYLETVIRGYVSVGASPARIIGGTVGFLTTLSLVLERVLEPQHRLDAGRWMANFCTIYVGEMLTIALSSAG